MDTLLSDSDLKDPGTRVLYFYANWVPLIRRMTKNLVRLEKEFNVPFTAVDVDAFPNLAKVYSVQSVPEIIMFKLNSEVGRVNGLTLTSALRSALREQYA